MRWSFACGNLNVTCEKMTPGILENPRYASMIHREYAKLRKYGADFLDFYLVSMDSAVWSTPPELMLDFPATTLLRFWHNHGLLGKHTRRSWWTVTGGSQSYVKKLSTPLSEPHTEGKVVVQPRQGPAVTYDKVILASLLAHAE